MKATPQTGWVWGCVIGVWALALAAGIWTLESYENSPGQMASAPAQWPTGTQLELASDRLTLVLFAHPACPCTRATLRELERLSSRLGALGEITVIFSQPAEAPIEWEHSDLLALASAIPGVRCRLDRQRQEANRFQVRTSGQVLVYRPDGRLEFAGGLTSARGHEGENAGTRHILALARSGEGLCNGASGGCSVYGCPLFESSPAPPAGLAASVPSGH